MRGLLRIIVIAIVAVSSAAWLLMSATAQKRRNEFFHSTAAHKKIGCASCHKVPTANWEGARGFPDVADYPGHSSCIQCHRDDFFRGNSPAICSICHTAAGPRSGARFPFPVRARSTEFSTIFPHDAHQDIIARNSAPYRQRVAHTTAAGSAALQWEGTVPAHIAGVPAVQTYIPAHFVNVSFIASPPDDPPPQFNNCAICHQTTSSLPKFGSRAPQGQALAPAVGDNFVPGAAFFKDGPAGHSSCFSCHYQGQKPVRTDCAGCHQPAAAHFETGVITRYSLKFDHQSPNHVNKDCTTCHVRITQTSDLAAMRGADVPFVTCASCHAAQLKEETEKRAGGAGKPPVFQCAYCHSPEIGRFEIPVSHRGR